MLGLLTGKGRNTTQYTKCSNSSYATDARGDWRLPNTILT